MKWVRDLSLRQHRDCPSDSLHQSTKKTLIVLLLPSIVIPYWYHTVKKLEHDMVVEVTHGIASRVDNAAKLVLPINSSALQLASMLGSVHKQVLFSEVQSKVALVLLEALLITPHSTQTSYIGLDGLFFSYYKDGDDKIYAVYSNSTFTSSNSSTGGYTWYSQPVLESGELYGDAKIMEPFAVLNDTWFQNATNGSNNYASLGFSWTSKRTVEPDLFLDTARLGRNGVVSLGYSVKGITDFFSGVNINGGSLYMATTSDHGRVLLQGIEGVQIKSTGDTALVYGGSSDEIIGEISCETRNGVGVATNLNIGQTDLISYCSHITIARVPLVYVFAVPRNGNLLGGIHKHTKVTLILLIAMMTAMVISVFVFVALIVRAGWREVQLCAAYMRQMDKTAQAERKSLKQGLAFASANHDIRGYLACIKGLLDLCYNEIQPSSELASNYKKIDACADDLLAMVNSILDFSKIEAGKMQLEEGNYDLEQLLEDIADLHHPVASKKGVEIVLDPCDGSIVKFSSVIGDRGKLKQILCNLLSNAVKYTPSGHISIRAWAKKSSFENSIISSNQNSLLSRLSRLFYGSKYDNLEEDMRTINEDSNCMELVFEVEDTGLGIPKDKRKSIFEDFVQVKENSSGQVGTGLGLGIVQALVRLMGGDIEIVDKANGEEGTCFRFNVFLTVQESASVNNPFQEKETYSSELTSCARSPGVEGSIVVLFMKNDERRRMVKRYMESLGIKVVVLKQVNRINHVLKKKVRFNLINPSQCYSSSSESLPLSFRDGCNDSVVVRTKSSFPGTAQCIMLILDANAGNFLEMRRSVSLLRKDNLETFVKVVWLDRPETRKAHFSSLTDESLPLTDCIIQEPLHGNRLFRVVKLLPEFGGELIKVSRHNMRSGTVFPYNLSSEGEELRCSSSERPLSRARSMIYKGNDYARHEFFLDKKSLSCDRSLATVGGSMLRGHHKQNLLGSPPPATSRIYHGEIEEHSDSSSCKSSRLKNCSMSETPSVGPVANETQNIIVDPSLNMKPLVGKNFLIADDMAMGRKLTTALITQLGGQAEVCENGKEALELICKALNDLGGDVNLKFPYDYVLMDCQMEVMDGFEATRRIRQEESKHGIYIPVIALTAHEAGEAGDEITEAGMDFHMTKPLKKDQLLEIMKLICSR